MSFKHLQQYEVEGRVAYLTLDMIKGAPTLTLRPANRANPAWVRAIAAVPKSKIRSITEPRTPAAREELQEFVRETYSTLVLAGWTGVIDDANEEVPFSVEKAREFLAALPPWIIERIVEFASDPANFSGGDEEAMLGNSKAASAGHSNTAKKAS